MITLETAGENRCKEHLAGIDAKRKRKPIYVAIPKVELPDSADERAKLWDYCVLETALGLKHLIYSDDPDTARWAIEQLVALEKTSVRHNRRLAGTERPRAAVPEFGPLSELPPLDLPTPTATKRTIETLEQAGDDFPPEFPAADARRQTEALDQHIDAAHSGLVAAVDELKYDADLKARLMRSIPREWAVWLVRSKLMHEEAMPSDFETDYFRGLNCRGPLLRYLKYSEKPKEELIRSVFPDYADELLEMEAMEERE